MINKHKILIAVAILVIIALAWWHYSKPDISSIVKTPASGSQTPPVNGGLNIAPADPVKTDDFPFVVGKSNGPKVKMLQQALNTINEKNLGGKYTPLVVDGDFGNKTYSAIVTWAGTMYWSPSGLTENNYNAILAKANGIDAGDNGGTSWWGFFL